MSQALEARKPVNDEPDNLLPVIMQAARDQSIDVTKLERLVALHERSEARRAEQAFNSAMNDAQTKIRPIAADASNPQTKSKYASYLALDRALRPIYTEYGFSLSFDTGEGAPADFVRVLCYCAHQEGHSRTYKIDIPADGKGAKGGDVMTKTHATGAAMTYGQRYLLKMIFNIAVGDDNDGNAASTGGEPLNDEEVERIFSLLKRTDSDQERFCKFMGVAMIADIPRKDYGKALERLHAKLDAKEREAKK